MTSEKFRHQLRQEAQSWQAEGLIDAELYEHLARRYQFADLDTTARNRFTGILLGLGSILLGLAVITLVAANWQAWSRELKVLLLLGLFVGVNAAGFYLWREAQGRWTARLGVGLLLCGALILGANLGLMSQMFHLGGPVYQLFLVWGLGVLSMAYSLRLSALGILSAILVSLAYGSGRVTEWIPQGSWKYSLAAFTIEHLPLLAVLAFVPLAYWCRSRWLFGIGSVLAIVALEINTIVVLSDYSDWSNLTEGAIAVLLTCLPTALLWSYRDSLWNILPNGVSFNSLSRKLAVLGFSLLLFWASFNIWDFTPSTQAGEFNGHNGLKLLDLIIFSGLTLWAWWRLGKENDRGFGWQIDRNSTFIALMLLLAGSVIGIQIAVAPLGAIATIIFNLLLFLLGVGLIREAVKNGTRLGFWGGTILLVLQLFARMLEYDTGLLLKALVLFLCGIAVIAAGLWFERHLRAT